MGTVNALEGASVLEAIYDRHAVREYTSEEVDRITIDALIADASQAPSAMNLQPWAFAIFTGVERLRGFSKRARAHLLASRPELACLLEPDANVFYDAPVLIVICATNGLRQSAEDCCLAAQNLMLSAYARGLGTCPIGFSRDWLCLPETKAELGIPADAIPVFAVVVGHPKSQPESHGRRPPVVYG